MLSNRLGILGALAMVLAVVQVPGKPISPPTTTRISPRQHAPMRFHGLRPNGTVESDNWSGYAVTGSSFTQALGSWIVPTVNCMETPNTESAFWVGLGGYSSNALEQIGTDSDCNGTSPSYYAWYEFYPKFPVTITSVPVSQGDIISAEVSYNGKQFTVTLTDQSTGQFYSKSSNGPQVQASSAEWIAEAPCCTKGGGILPLSNFGTVSFGQDSTRVGDTNYATDTSTSGPIVNFGSNVEQITMVSSMGADQAVPSSLSTDGTSFTVTWKSE